MAMTVMYNGVQFAPVSARQSIVISHSAEVLWSVVGKFGRMALWMGTVEGQLIYSQLLGGETNDFIGAVRVFGIGDKMLFEQLTKLDNQDRIMAWQLTTNPMNSNPFPAAFVNCTASLQVTPVTLPGNQALIEWRIDLLTEQQHVAHMTKAMDDIMIVGLTNLVKYMEKTVGHSSGDHSAAFLGSGILGSTVAPAAVGVQYIPQPAAPMQPQMPISQAVQGGPLTGDSAFLRQPTFVPAPGQSLAGPGMSNAPPSVHQPQQNGQPTMYSQLQLQQLQRQQREQHQHNQFQQHQQWLLQHQQQQFQQQSYQYQHMPMTQQQQQHQQQHQQQAYQQQLNQNHSGSSTMSATRHHAQPASSHGAETGAAGAQQGAGGGSQKDVHAQAFPEEIVKGAQNQHDQQI